MMDLIKKWFHKNTNFKTELLKVHPEDFAWRVVSFSFENSGYDHRHTKIQLQNSDKQWILQFPQKKKSHSPVLIQNHSWQADSLEKADETALNVFLHETMRISMEELLDFMRAPVTGVTSVDYQNEAQYLKWFEVSLTVLSKALDRFEKDPSLVLTGCFFAGERPEKKEKIVRLIIFNLDIFFYLQPDNALRILIFDDKDKGHGENQAPVFQQIIKVTKPQFYDQMILILQRITQYGEFH